MGTGSDIISAVFDQASATAEGYGSTPQDPRNSSYHLASISGTSMASPQVAGIIACLVEQEPNLTQAEALQHLIENSLTEVGSQGLPEQSPYEGFGDSLNRYAFIPKKRPDGGMASPLNYIRIEIPLQLNILELGIKQPLKTWQLIKHHHNN